MNRLRFRGLAAVLGLLVLAAAAGIGQSSTVSARSEGVSVAFLLPNGTDPRWQQDAQTFVRRLSRRDPKASWAILNASNSETTQISQALSAVDGGTRVLVVAPVDPISAEQIVAYAQPRGVRVIAYGRPIDAANVSLFVGFDPEAAGRMIGDFVLDHVPRGNIVIIQGPIGDDTARLENRGLYADVLRSSVASGRYAKTLQVWEPAWSSAAARSSTYIGLIDVHRDVAGFVDESDVLAAGTIRGLQSTHLNSVVTGAGSSLGALRQILEGNQSMTAFEPGSFEASAAADATVAFLHGSRLSPAFSRILKTPSETVRSALFRPILVTRSSVRTLVTDGYLVATPRQGAMNVRSLCAGIAAYCRTYGVTRRP